MGKWIEIHKTPLIPLWGRAKEYAKPRPLVKDKFAHGIIGKLDYDFESMNADMPAQVHINCAIRAHHIDAMLLGILEEHPDATIISIGAGLDTTFHRIDNGKIFWYDLDLEDSMALRRKLIPESDRNVFIAKSVFDRSWFKDVKERRNRICYRPSHGGSIQRNPEASSSL